MANAAAHLAMEIVEMAKGEPKPRELKPGMMVLLAMNFSARQLQMYMQSQAAGHFHLVVYENSEYCRLIDDFPYWATRDAQGVETFRVWLPFDEWALTSDDISVMSDAMRMPDTETFADMVISMASDLLSDAAHPEQCDTTEHMIFGVAIMVDNQHVKQLSTLKLGGKDYPVTKQAKLALQKMASTFRITCKGGI